MAAKSVEGKIRSQRMSKTQENINAMLNER